MASLAAMSQASVKQRPACSGSIVSAAAAKASRSRATRRTVWPAPEKYAREGEANAARAARDHNGRCSIFDEGARVPAFSGVAVAAIDPW